MSTEDNNRTGKQARRPRFFYGWVIVFACICLGITHTGVLNLLLSLFMKPMIDEFRWSRATFSSVVFVAAVGGSVISYFVGPFIDKHGPRLVMAVGGAFIGLTVASFSLVQQLWHFYLLFGLGRSAMAGGTNLAMPAVVANWFHRKRGRAMSISQTGNLLGGAVLPFIALWLINGWGWRYAWMCLGISMALIAMIPSLLVRRRPEDMGLLPDGDSPSAVAQHTPTPRKKMPSYPSQDTVWTRHTVLRTPAFWVIAVADSTSTLGFAAINMHHLPRLTDAGIPSSVAVATVSLAATCASITILFWGLLSEKTGGRLCVILVLLCLAAAALLLNAATNIPMAYLFSIVWGIAKGGMMPIIAFAWAEYFGRKSLATVRSAATPFTLFGNACGPLFASLSFDITGSYSYFIYILTAVLIVSSATVFFSRAPQRTVVPASTQPTG